MIGPILGHSQVVIFHEMPSKTGVVVSDPITTNLAVVVSFQRNQLAVLHNIVVDRHVVSFTQVLSRKEERL